MADFVGVCRMPSHLFARRSHILTARSCTVSYPIRFAVLRLLHAYAGIANACALSFRLLHSLTFTLCGGIWRIFGRLHFAELKLYLSTQLQDVCL